MMQEAKFYKKEKDNSVRCLLCPHVCRIKDGERGKCGVRQNIDGALYAISYAKISALQIDPIEKKPLYHFYPGTEILSLGSIGCNFSCAFCQNYTISLENIDAVPTEKILPQDLLSFLEKNPKPSVAYTYNEPFINFEYIFDCAKSAHDKGVKNVLVTNGFVNPEPLKEIIPFIDAANIDIKGFNNDFYYNICGGFLENVKKTAQIMYERGVHIELTYLLIPTRNYEKQEFKRLLEWIRDIDKRIPFHISRYFPAYKMTDAATSVEVLKEAHSIAEKYLDYVYVGNVNILSDTKCPNCEKILITRNLYNTEVKGLSGNKCSECGEIIWGRFD
ncbi:AmmeMemoRadiSam system radical SAM enzyme [bacterium]